jgi:hypothetical protein
MDELRCRKARAETSLSVLDVGIRPPRPTILLTTLALTFIGDDLRDALDPRPARLGASKP